MNYNNNQAKQDSWIVRFDRELQFKWSYHKTHTPDAIIRWFVWKLPKRIVMGCCYRVAANATQGEWGNVSPADLKFFDMVSRWK